MCTVQYRARDRLFISQDNKIYCLIFIHEMRLIKNISVLMRSLCRIHFVKKWRKQKTKQKHFAKESKRKCRLLTRIFLFYWFFFFLFFFLVNHLKNTWNGKWFFRRRQGDNKWAESQERFFFVLDFFFCFQYNQKVCCGGVGKWGKDVPTAPAEDIGRSLTLFSFFIQNRHLEITSRETIWSI